MRPSTPKPPYHAVIFSAQRSSDDAGYDATAERMRELAQRMPGFLGMDSAGSDHEITVSYWRDLESIRYWKQQADHQQAQQMGRNRWYSRYDIRVATVERDDSFPD